MYVNRCHVMKSYIGEKQNFKHNVFVEPKPVNGSRSTGVMWSYFLPFMISRAAQF